MNVVCKEANDMEKQETVGREISQNVQYSRKEIITDFSRTAAK